MSKAEEAARAQIQELLGPNGVGMLSPIESRLVRVAVELFPQVLQHARIDLKNQTMLDLTPALVAHAGLLSLSAAVAMDDELRRLRAELERKAGNNPEPARVSPG